jgi:dTDP-4-dehydrorhamnose reductase
MAAAPESGITRAAGRAELDLTRPPTVIAALDDFRPDIVINTAAWTAVDQAEREPGGAFAVNRDGAGALARLCAARAIALIHISTDYVFNGEKNAPYSETDPPDPLNVYGRSKLEGEQAVMEAGGRHLILRTSWLHSPHEGNFISAMLNAARRRGSVRVVSSQHGSPTSAPHLARAIWTMAARLAADADAPGGLFHVANGGVTTWAGLAREVFAISAALGGPAAKVEEIDSDDFPATARRPRNSALDCAKLERQWRIRLPGWREGVRENTEKMLRNRGWKDARI